MSYYLNIISLHFYIFKILYDKSNTSYYMSNVLHNAQLKAIGRLLLTYSLGVAGILQPHPWSHVLVKRVANVLMRVPKLFHSYSCSPLLSMLLLLYYTIDSGTISPLDLHTTTLDLHTVSLLLTTLPSSFIVQHGFTLHNNLCSWLTNALIIIIIIN